MPKHKTPSGFKLHLVTVTYHVVVLADDDVSGSTLEGEVERAEDWQDGEYEYTDLMSVDQAPGWRGDEYVYTAGPRADALGEITFKDALEKVKDGRLMAIGCDRAALTPDRPWARVRVYMEGEKLPRGAWRFSGDDRRLWKAPPAMLIWHREMMKRAGLELPRGELNSGVFNVARYMDSFNGNGSPVPATGVKGIDEVLCWQGLPLEGECAVKALEAQLAGKGVSP